MTRSDQDKTGRSAGITHHPLEEEQDRQEQVPPAARPRMGPPRRHRVDAPGSTDSRENQGQGREGRKSGRLPLGLGQPKVKKGSR